MKFFDLIVITVQGTPIGSDSENEAEERDAEEINIDAEELESADEVDNVGNLSDRACLIPFGHLPGASDTRMRYFVDQTKLGEEYYGASALNTTTEDTESNRGTN